MTRPDMFKTTRKDIVNCLTVWLSYQLLEHSVEDEVRDYMFEIDKRGLSMFLSEISMGVNAKAREGVREALRRFVLDKALATYDFNENPHL